MNPDEIDWQNWPVWPDGVQAVVTLRIPDGYEPPPTDCFACGEPIIGNEPVWGVPERGIAHDHCYPAAENEDE